MGVTFCIVFHISNNKTDDWHLTQNHEDGINRISTATTLEFYNQEKYLSKVKGKIMIFS
jgi:hypothetical protein